MVVNSYKLWYAGFDDIHSWVSILVAIDILKQVVEVRRCNERIMLVKIVVGEEVILVITAYGPQIELRSK